MKEQKEVNKRIMWIEIEADYDRWLTVITYGPGSRVAEEVFKKLHGRREREREIL